MSGAFFASADVWDRIVLRERERLGPVTKLDADMLTLDVAYLIDRAIRPNDAKDFPTFDELRARWGTAWAKSSLSDKVNAPGFCVDPRKADAWASYWDALRARRARGANRGERGVNGARTGGERAVNGGEQANADSFANGERAVNGERTGSERRVNVVGALVLEAPSTQHPTPAPETETRAPEVAPPPKPKRTKPSPDQPSDSERADWDDLLGAYAEIDPDGARRIDGGRSAGLAREALALLRAGPDIAVRRLRYLARGPGRDAEFARRADGPRGSALLRRSSPWCATVDDAAAAWADRASMLAAQPTDARWRDPGWSPTRRAEPAHGPPGKPPPESITERALTVHELARQLQENRHAARDHRHDDRDLLALEGGGPQTPGGMARRTG